MDGAPQALGSTRAMLGSNPNERHGVGSSSMNHPKTAGPEQSGPVRYAAEPLSCHYNVKSLTHGEEPDLYSTSSVEACHFKRWTISTWKKATPLEIEHYIYQCRSWRHAGPCRQFKGAQDFARIKVALSKRSQWVYMVLTYPQFDRAEIPAMYRKIGRNLQSFRQNLVRKYGPLEYIVLVEQHKSGYPHVNMLVHNPLLCAEAYADYRKPRKSARKSAMRCGFGPMFWLEGMRSKKAMAGYMVKLMGEADTMNAELAKLNQAPVTAPRRFNRLRSSVGLLPPSRKPNPETTGRFHQRRAGALRKEERDKALVRLTWAPEKIAEKLDLIFRVQRFNDYIRTLSQAEKKAFLNHRPRRLPTPANLNKVRDRAAGHALARIAESDARFSRPGARCAIRHFNYPLVS